MPFFSDLHQLGRAKPPPKAIKTNILDFKKNYNILFYNANVVFRSGTNYSGIQRLYSPGPVNTAFIDRHKTGEGLAEKCIPDGVFVNRKLSHFDSQKLSHPLS
jgi:hypothetical protein